MNIWNLLRIKTVVEMEDFPSEQAFEDASYCLDRYVKQEWRH